MTASPTPRPKRLDERVAPGWANIASNLLRGGGLLVGLLLVWLGFVTGGFFLLLTGVLAAIALVGGWVFGGLMTREDWYERPNARLNSLGVVVGFPVALVVFAQIAGPFLTPPPTLTACYTGSLQRGGTLETTMAVDPRINSMEFTLQLSGLQGGAVRYFMQDPAGQSQWSGRQSADGTYTSGPMQAVGGAWAINVVSEADQASYRLDWHSLDPPADASAGGCLE